MTEETKRLEALEARLAELAERQAVAEDALRLVYGRLIAVEEAMGRERAWARELTDAVAAALKLIGDRTGRGGGPAAPLTGVN